MFFLFTSNDSYLTWLVIRLSPSSIHPLLHLPHLPNANVPAGHLQPHTPWIPQLSITPTIGSSSFASLTLANSEHLRETFARTSFMNLSDFSRARSFSLLNRWLSHICHCTFQQELKSCVLLHQLPVCPSFFTFPTPILQPKLKSSEQLPFLLVHLSFAIISRQQYNMSSSLCVDACLAYILILLEIFSSS